jgi:hypothetical protein
MARASKQPVEAPPTEELPPRPVAKVDPDVLPIWPDTGRPGGEAAMALAHDHPDYEFPKEVHNMLVSALAAHVALSAMADSKASILMGATFLVFTLTIGQLTTAALVINYPLLVLGGFAFVATVLSVMAVMPKIKIPKGHNPNWLFFGVFTTEPQEQYVDRIIGLMRSEEATYRAMARDLYQNGMVMQKKKYYYLARAYQAFLVGIVLTLAAFLIQVAVR